MHAESQGSRQRLHMGPDERAIRDLHSTWIHAVNAGDLARLLDLLADDVVFLSPGRAPFGRDGFTTGFTAAHEQFRIRCTSELQEVVVVSDLACARSRDALTVNPHAGGAASHFAGDRLTIYRKHSD